LVGLSCFATFFADLFHEGRLYTSSQIVHLSLAPTLLAQQSSESTGGEPFGACWHLNVCLFPSKLLAHASSKEAPVSFLLASPPKGRRACSSAPCEISHKLSSLLQMRGVASSPPTSKPGHQSLSDAALAASSAAASASAIAAAAAAVVQSASAAAVAVRKPETPVLYDSSGGREVAKAERRANFESRYSDLISWYSRLSDQGSKNTWLLAYVAVAVSFPLVGVLRVRALQRFGGTQRGSRLTRRVGVS
jgi:hypothetical protein